MKPTQHELIVRYLLKHRGVWIPSHQLQQKQTEHGWIGSEGDRRARELAQDGFYDTKSHRIYIHRRKNGKYAEYRVTALEPITKLTTHA